jgi:lysyl endopeptidase
MNKCSPFKLNPFDLRFPLLLAVTTFALAVRVEAAQASRISDPIPRKASATALALPIKTQQSALLPALSADIIDCLKNQPPKQTKGRLQIGIGRQLDHAFIVNSRSVPAQDWTVQPDGTRTWSVSITSQGGLGIRLHLESLNLPPGGRLLLYSGSRPDLAPLITTYADLDGQHDLWMQTVFSDQVTLTCQVPAADVPAVSFQIAELSHLFAVPKVGDYTKEGTCHNDVTCYGNWASEAAGVARISFIESGNSYLCSGCLLAANSSSSEFFLTAHHCVTSGNVASSVEFFWLYQTATCNGAAPDISTVPQTGGGGDLLAGSSGDDFSFLRLRRMAPAGVSFLNWSTDPPSANETLTCIHHPDGSYKRISFGKYYDSDADFWAVQWYSGVTEGGSSGSPLFNANHQVIGQLNGGFGGPGSSCNDPSAPDQFGRFDLAYPSVKKWLSGSSTPPGTDFSAVKGVYNGLFSDDSSGDPENSSGFVSLSITAGGKFSGRIQIGSQKYSMSGQLDASGMAATDVKRRSGNPLSVQLQVDLSGASDQITGSVTDGSFDGNLAAYRSPAFSKSSPSFSPGHYTFIIPGNPGSGSEPGGDGYATVTLDRSGKVKMTGVLGDGTKISQSTSVSQSGQWPFYVGLYGGQGSILGWLSFGDLSSSDLSGDVRWVRPLIGGAKYYPDGFTISRSIDGSYYTRPAGGNTILSIGDGQVNLAGGDLNPDLSTTFTMLPGSKVLGTGDAKLGLTFSLTTGVFTGRLIDPGSGQAAVFHGVVLQRQNVGAGNFLGPDQTGEASIQ